MQEDFLHYIWKLKKFDASNLKTTNNEAVEIVSVGQHNLNSGPDFFNAQLKIDDQLWAGNVEIHVKSSDWFVHNHEVDTAYDNVILHVVWEHDTEIFRKDNTKFQPSNSKIIYQKVHWRTIRSYFQNLVNGLIVKTTLIQLTTLQLPIG